MKTFDKSYYYGYKSYKKNIGIGNVMSKTKHK